MAFLIEPFSIQLSTAAIWPTSAEAAGRGLAQLVRIAMQRVTGADAAEAQIAGSVAVDERADGRWKAEIVVTTPQGRGRHVVEAEFDEAHHLLFRLVEFAAKQAGKELPESAIRAFEDLHTPSPLATLAYWEGWGCEGAERRQLWMRAFELDPNFVAARTALAQAILDDGGVPAAAAGLAHGLGINDAYAASALGLDLWAMGAAEVATELLQAAVRANPNDALAAAGLAALVARGLEHDRDNAENHAALEEALLLATQATQLAPDDYRCWAALATVYRAKGDFPQAGFYYGFALRLEPGAPSVLKDAGASWLLARDPHQALPLIKRALEAAPNDAENHGNLAFARDLLNEPEAALEAARRAAALAPDNARLRILHGDLALKAGKNNEAFDAWAMAVTLEPGMTINPEGGNIGLPEVPAEHTA